MTKLSRRPAIVFASLALVVSMVGGRQPLANARSIGALKLTLMATADIPVGLEVPLASQYPRLSPGERLALLVKTSRDFLAQKATK